MKNIDLNFFSNIKKPICIIFSWGEEGYIRLKRESKAQCGTNSTPMDGTACVGGPGNDEQHVCGQCGVLYDNSFPLGAYAIN